MYFNVTTKTMIIFFGLFLSKSFYFYFFTLVCLCFIAYHICYQGPFLNKINVYTCTCKISELPSLLLTVLNVKFQSYRLLLLTVLNVKLQSYLLLLLTVLNVKLQSYLLLLLTVLNEFNVIFSTVFQLYKGCLAIKPTPYLDKQTSTKPFFLTSQ